ncbi:MAG: aspartyl protease family protein [Bacteroidota bacterium]
MYKQILLYALLIVLSWTTSAFHWSTPTTTMTVLKKPKPKEVVPLVVPFKRIGGLVIVEAEIDGTKGNFIVDTGAPTLILNINRVDHARPSRTEQSLGINGQVNQIYEKGIRRMYCGEVVFKNIRAQAIDLSHLEKVRGIPLLGLLGHSLLKKYEVTFDHTKQELLFHHIDRKGRHLHPNTYNYYLPTDSIAFNMVGHIPCFVTSVGNRRMRLGLDTGAEINLFDKKHKATLEKRLAQKTTMDLHGVSSKAVSADVGKMSYFWIDCLKFQDMTTLFTNFKNFNLAYNRQLDGILGQEFIRQRKMSINFKKRKIYFWGPEEENCHLARK